MNTMSNTNMSNSNGMVLPGVSVLVDSGSGGLALLAGDLGLHRDTDLTGSGLADLTRHGVALLPRDRDAHLPGDLAGILDRPLLALPLSVGMALGTSGVPMVTTISSSSRPLAMSNSNNSTTINTTMSTRDDVRVMTNNTRAVVNLLGDLVPLLSHNILALLHIGGVHNGVMLGVADLVMFSVAGSLYMSVIQSLTVGVIDSKAVSTVAIGFSANGSTMVSNSATSRGQSSSREEEGEVHHGDWRENVFPPVR